jgi:hypothetical protein
MDTRVQFHHKKPVTVTSVDMTSIVERQFGLSVGVRCCRCTTVGAMNISYLLQHEDELVDLVSHHSMPF